MVSAVVCSGSRVHNPEFLVTLGVHQSLYREYAFFVAHYHEYAILPAVNVCVYTLVLLITMAARDNNNSAIYFGRFFFSVANVIVTVYRFPHTPRKNFLQHLHVRVPASAPEDYWNCQLEPHDFENFFKPCSVSSKMFYVLKSFVAATNAFHLVRVVNVIIYLLY